MVTEDSDMDNGEYIGVAEVAISTDDIGDRDISDVGSNFTDDD